MFYKTLILAITVAAFSSCSTAYKSTQTPDDVYYSPSRPVYAEKEASRDKVAEEYYDDAEDRQIVMGIRDRRWRYLNDPFAYNNFGYSTFGYNHFGYGSRFYPYTPYSFSYYNSPYNFSFNNWGNNYGYYYNPFYYPHPIYSPVIITKYRPAPVTRPRTINLDAYNGYNRNNIRRGYNNTNSTNTPGRYNNNNNRNSRVGNAIRRVLTPSSSSDNSDGNRTYSPSRSTNNSSNDRSPSSGSSGSNSGSISRPGRGN